MAHKPIFCRDLSFILPHKTCFSDVALRIGYGDRIAVMGPNGSGKSTLLSMIRSHVPSNVSVGFVAQIQADEPISGAEQFHRSLSRELASSPSLLLLDEPTNHLDGDNRRSLRRMLANFPHTLIVATHDEQLLAGDFNSFWCLADGELKVVNGRFDDVVALILCVENAVE